MEGKNAGSIPCLPKMPFYEAYKHGIELLKKLEMKYCILDCITDLLFIFGDFNVVLFSRILSLCCSSCLIFLSHRKSANETMIF